MEPSDLKPNSSDDAAVETWLRTHSALPPLPDDGFTPRVLTALPPPASHTLTLRTRICLAGALAGAAMAAWAVLSGGNPLDRLPALDAALIESLSQLGSPGAGLAVATTAASLLFAYWRDLRRFARW